MRPNDIADVRQVEDPRVAPDGSLVAFVVSDVEMEGNRYRRRVFLASVSGGAPPRPFTTGPLDTSPRWSPDGLVLAFVAGEEDGPSDLCVLPVRRGGERIVVARLAERPSELEWSPDGTELAFVVRDPDPEHYGEVGEKREPRDVPARRITRFYSRLNGEDFVVDRPKRLMVVAADGSGAPRRLTDGPFQAGDLAWSPDATRLAFCSGRHDTWDFDAAVDVFVIPSDGSAAAERLTETVGSYSSLSWSPDGGRITYLVDPTPMESPRHERLGVLALGDRSRTDVTGGIDRNLRPYGSSRPPVWAGERILCQVEDAGNVHVYAFGADGNGKPEPVVEGARWVGTFDAAGGTLAAAVTSPASFPELVVWALAADATATDEQRLTDVSGEFAARVRLVEPQPFVAPSRDGTDVPCWAMPPVGVETGRRYPTLLNVHGGPFTSFGNRFFDEFQMQTAAGFGVLYCNPRGSSGYSEAWGRAVRWPGARNDPGIGVGGRRLRGRPRLRRRGRPPLRLGRPRPARCAGRLVRWLHGLVGRRPHGPVQSRLLRAGLQQPPHARDVVGHRHRVPRLRRPDAPRGPRGLSRALTHLLRRRDAGAGPHPALRRRPPLPHQPGRGALRRAPPARPRARPRSLPGREPRTLSLGDPSSPGGARRDHPRLVQVPSGRRRLLTRTSGTAARHPGGGRRGRRMSRTTRRST